MRRPTFDNITRQHSRRSSFIIIDRSLSGHTSSPSIVHNSSIIPRRPRSYIVTLIVSYITPRSYTIALDRATRPTNLCSCLSRRALARHHLARRIIPRTASFPSHSIFAIVQSSPSSSLPTNTLSSRASSRSQSSLRSASSSSATVPTHPMSTNRFSQCTGSNSFPICDRQSHE